MTVELTEAEAYEYELDYFKTRLDDPSLLDRAVRFGGLLAVPVGGKRRGGCLSLGDPELCEQVVAELTGRDGFPNVHYENDEEFHMVCWGEQDMTWLRYEIERGRYYGYSEVAIGRYIDENLNP